LASRPALGLKPVDQIDGIEEPATRAVTDAGPRNGDRQRRLAGPGSADQHDVALMRQEVAADQIAHQGLTDRRAIKRKIVDVLCQRQLRDGDLILDRAWPHCILSSITFPYQVAIISIRQDQSIGISTAQEVRA
jgi:hypothetical protein